MDKVNTWEKELALLETILEKAELVETIKWGTKVYTYNQKNVVSFAGFKHHFVLWFYNGVFLSDPAKVLVSAQRGKTKSLRQWRFTDSNQLDEELIQSYVEEAILIEKQGLRMKPEKAVMPPIPVELAQVLDNDDELNSCFKSLTPGRQKEYIYYILEAKQLKTKLSRIAKITPLLLQKVGLNDKYKGNG